MFPDNLQKNEGYWQYFDSDFGQYLHDYLKVFEKHRQVSGMVPNEEEWKQLPFGPFAKNSDWKWRQQSLKVFGQITKGKHFDTTLEIGPWNGWLTKYLAQKSNAVIAADYFTGKFDGIGNLQDLAENILPVQCNVETLQTDFKPRSFDLIVVNHNLSFMGNPVEYLKGLMPLLKRYGIIISIGNVFFRNPKDKIQTNILLTQNYKAKFQQDLYIQPVKGFMDFEDRNQLKKLGFIITEHNAKLLQNWYSRFNAKAPRYCHILYKNA